MSANAPSPASGKPPIGADLWTLFAVVFVNLIGFGVVVPLLPFFAASLDADPWQVTLMFSAYSLGQFFAEPLWGRLSDRMGRRPILIATIAANVIGYLALAFAPNIWFAIAIRLFTGFGAGNVSTVQGYVADVTPPAYRAGRLGLIGAAFGAGFIIGPAMGGLLAQDGVGPEGYRLPLFVAAGMAALATLGVILFVKESRKPGAAEGPRPRLRAAMSEARRDPVISRVVLVTFVYMGAFAGMESTFGLWSAAKFDWGARETGLLFLVIGVVAAVAQAFLTGRLARRFGEDKLLAFGMLLFGACLAIQTLHSEPWLVPVFTGLGALGQSLAYPCIAALISRRADPERQGAFLGLNMAAGSAARIAGPALAGVLFTTFGPDMPLWIGALLVVPAAIMALNAGKAFRKLQE